MNPPPDAGKSLGKRPAIFLDRDGTLMHEVDYCGDPALVQVFPVAPAALARLKGLGFALVMTTNQSGIGRGYFTEGDYARVQAECLRQLGPDLLDASYHCPDAPEHATECRKPAPGMLLAAARDLALDLSASCMIGDSATDVECGRRAGVAAAILVLTGKGGEHRADCQPDFVARDLADAADWILAQHLNQHG